MFFSRDKKLMAEVVRLGRRVRELEDSLRGLELLVTRTEAMDAAVARDWTEPLPLMPEGTPFALRKKGET